jgi:hypothetical protein
MTILFMVIDSGVGVNNNCWSYADFRVFQCFDNYIGFAKFSEC